MGKYKPTKAAKAGKENNIMQDFCKFNYTITTAELAEAAEAITSEIIVIINGENYILKKPNQETSAE